VGGRAGVLAYVCVRALSLFWRVHAKRCGGRSGKNIFAGREKNLLAYVDNGQAGRYLVNIGSHDEGHGPKKGFNMQAELSDKARAFLAENPTLVGRVLGFKIYEHPTRGDESLLYLITQEGNLKRLSYYELPSAEELALELSSRVVRDGEW
jgi:hypothetical protein